MFRALQLPPFLSEVVRRLRWHRRAIAAVFGAAAAFLIIRVATAPPQPTLDVVTAARDLAAGSVLTSEDLTTSQYLRASAPTKVVARVGDAAGRILAAPLTTGAPLTKPALLGDHWPLAETDQTAVPVRLGDPATADLLRVGDHVQLLAIDPHQPDNADVIAPAVVLAIPPRGEGRTATTSTTTGRTVVVGVPAERSKLVAAASVSRYLTVTWSS